MDFYLLSNHHIAQVEEVDGGYQVGSFNGNGVCERFPETLAGNKDDAISSFLSSYGTDVTVVQPLGTYMNMYECLDKNSEYAAPKKVREDPLKGVRDYASNDAKTGKLDRFGFKDVIIDAKRAEKDVIDEIEETFGAIAQVLSIDDADIGLNHTLTLEVRDADYIRGNSKTPSSTEAYFTPDYRLVIHPGLERMIHEWGHALDSHVANLERAEKGKKEIALGKVNTETRRGLLFLPVRNAPVYASWDMEFPDEYKKNSKKADKINPDKTQSTHYYQRETEMYARAFERNITDRINAETDVKLQTDFSDFYEPTSEQASKVMEQMLPHIQHLKDIGKFHDRNDVALDERGIPEIINENEHPGLDEVVHDCEAKHLTAELSANLDEEQITDDAR